MNRLMIHTIPAHMAKLTATAAQIESAMGQRFCTGFGAAAMRMSAWEMAARVWGTMYVKTLRPLAQSTIARLAGFRS